MDVVITYVQLTNEFKKNYKKYVKNELIERRFRSYDTLDIQVKLIRKYMPYVNNIFIVVSGEDQIPNNLNICKIIYHKDIIPEKYLPCFNSCSIEMFLHKIPDLGEEFVYFNDDIFVIDYIPYEYFFKRGKPCLNMEIKNYENNSGIYINNLYNSTQEISKLLRCTKKFNDKYIQYSHSCRPFLKSTCEKLFNKLNFILISSLTRTRHSKNFNMTIFNNYDYMSLNYNDIYKNYIYVNNSENLEVIYNYITNKVEPIICINDNDFCINFNIFKDELHKILESNLLDRKYTLQNITKYPINVTDKLIVSFTSWEKRIKYCKHTVDLMMHQTIVPDKIILNLSEEEFPNKKYDLPIDLIAEEIDNDKFEIYWVKENTTVWKKIIPTLNRFPNDVIFSIDDDIEYPANYIEEMYRTYCENNKLNPVVAYEYLIDDNNLCHSGPFTLTSKKFYEDLLNKVYNELILPSLPQKKWQSDIVYYKVLNSLGYKYIRCNSINGNLLYNDSELNKENRYSLWDKDYKEERKENIRLIDNFLLNNIDNYLDGISICISAYKADKYIKETLDSIVNQTWFKDNNNWEVIIGIDGCNQTLDYIKTIMINYDSSHFSFYMMSNNQGTYITSNTLMSKIAKYKWVLRFDSDDIMHPNMIETIINNIDSKTDIIRFCLQNFADNNYTLNDETKINKSYISYGQICINHIKFNRYGGYLPWKCSADAEFLSRTRRFLKQKKLQDILFDRRITDNSLTNSSATNNKSELRKQYDDYVKTVSINIKDRNEAINKDFKVNTYYKVKPYELIVSLTSFPERIRYVKSVVESIVNTNIDKEIYKLIVVLSSEEFVNKENDLPEDLVSYCNDNCIEILWYEKNIRSHKKLIPVIKKYPQFPVLVIDDDIIRTEEWFKMFINDRRKYPEDILCMRCDDYITDAFECIHDRSNFENGVKFEDIIYHNRPSNGCGGTLYPPNTFTDKIFFDEDLFMELSPSSDEMWQFCFNIMNNQIIRRTSNLFEVESIKGSQKISLYKENKGKYTEIMNKLLNYFPKYKLELMKKINSENEINNYKAVVALTSWKKRINNVYKTIENLLIHAANKYKIVLTLSIEEFPNKENDLPINLLMLLSNNNFEILWVRKNYKVFKKLLFTMSKYKNLPIISADDDIIYKYNYLDELYNKWLDDKDYVISEGYEIHYNLNNELFKFSKGCATLFPPGILLDSIKYLNEEILSTQNDDSFYGIYCHLNGIKIKYIHNNINSLIMPHTNDGAITIGVKNKEDFLQDKLIILKNIQQYKEV